MLPVQTVRPPFFEIGPKAYLHGDDVLQLALAADRASVRYGVQVLFTAPLLELSRVAAITEHILVCAPHMDPIRPGRGVADVLPEAVRDAGARGVMLNHAERPVSYAVLERTVHRAEEVGLLTIVCANSIAEVRAVASLSPDIIVAEPTELIGSAGGNSDLGYIHAAIATVREVNPDILILQAAGISGPADVYRVISAGADATGSSSAIATAADPAAMVDQMVRAVREAWDVRAGQPLVSQRPSAAPVP